MFRRGRRGDVWPFKKSSDDLQPAVLPPVSWAVDRQVESLEALFQHVVQQTTATIRWYLREKESKRWKGRWFRLVALAAISVSGILPVLALILARDGRPLIQPAWATVALALATALGAIDHFCGYSNAWMRFVETEQDIKKALDDFQFDWEIERASWTNERPEPAQVRAALYRFKGFTNQVNLLIQQETKSWIAEFKSTLTMIDEAARAKAESSPQCGANVVVTNGDSAQDGWSLSVDGGTEIQYRGKSAAVRDLLPGLRTFAVKGMVDGQWRQAQLIAPISSNTTARVELTLS